ncbi:hypothetical protein PR202_gb04488 [Eleusine coracana subsp. coracana]|uniref:Uncharacterized protein n=1 Tax=Eleusine coracana subsp. coracana TaxID=191504 RepID=A0AAV5E5G4_ELECO|nr:hypothetical protein PR202_gb04488 [Eleusine coracana subsp. coracana]
MDADRICLPRCRANHGVVLSVASQEVMALSWKLGLRVSALRTVAAACPARVSFAGLRARLRRHEPWFLVQLFSDWVVLHADDAAGGGWYVVWSSSKRRW